MKMGISHVVFSTGMLLSTLMFVRCDRMTSKIYENLKADNFCFRQLNSTHQIGCTSNAAGNVGVVHVVETTEDLKWVLQEGPDPPYIAALHVAFFNMGNMTDLKNSNRISGVLVLQATQNLSLPEEGSSPDKLCPNENYGLYRKDMPGFESSCSKGVWNPKNPSTNMLFEDWGMPIVLVTNDSDIQSIVEGCYQRFNAPINNTARSWPLCAAELGSFMLAAKDSPTCIRRSNMYTNMNPVKLCDPLGSRNVITTLFPTNQEEPLLDRSMIVVAARLDAASMFDHVAPGADSAVTALVTLMSVAETMFKVKEEIMNKTKGSETNVLFAVFNGESFDYIGSSRAVFDMERNEFPQKLDEGKQQPALIKLQHISRFIELHQVGPEKGAENIFFVHTDPISRKNPEVNAAVTRLLSLLKGFNKNISESDPERPLPPASVQRFLRKDLNISALVVTNFDKNYKNKHYNSRYDLGKNISPVPELHLASLATTISKALYNMLTGEDHPTLASDPNIIQEMLDCYLNNASCLLFQQIASPSMLNQNPLTRIEPYSLYVSVDSHGNVNPITIYTRYLMSYLTGEKLFDHVEGNCTSNATDQIYQYDWMVGPDSANKTGICIRSTVEYTMALSPAFELNDWESTEYSTWTESVWQTATLRIFLRPSRKLEGLTLGVGCIIFILSLLVVYSANKRAELLFGTRGLFGC